MSDHESLSANGKTSEVRDLLLALTNLGPKFMQGEPHEPTTEEYPGRIVRPGQPDRWTTPSESVAQIAKVWTGALIMERGDIHG